MPHARPILRETSGLIADPQVRYMGTLGGNAANGDPGNDMPAVMMALGATYVLKGAGGERRVAARDYYRGIYDTAAQPGEILAEIRIPAPPKATAGPTKSSSARSATTRPPPRRSS